MNRKYATTRPPGSFETSNRVNCTVNIDKSLFLEVYLLKAEVPSYNSHIRHQGQVYTSRELVSISQ